ncbi:MAG: DNA-binding response regulator [Treponema sp. GWB1_62_6]|nr:MAG: DNA-binding response regulator [Treponema sp. GWA1_62_8]OHE66142.1 MAG: DNA-binding response regulator [Treponema sp. GWB1_62_6]OHE69357.1 MAG: DNA-binding response regulator [Treponema sp. RIFOXYC1_FULL_61_9]HCM28540.1 DNA-binding response regulator [Treponema sp.]
MSDMIQIIIVDDHPIFRDGVVKTLEAEPDIEIVGQATSAEEAERLAGELLPDLILLDITIPGGGLHAAKAIAASSPFAKIVMLTASEAEDDVLAALKAGARGYILKGVSGRDLVKIIRSVHAGEAYVTPSLAASLLSDMQEGSRGCGQEPSPLDELTEREHQILKKLASGLSNKEIAQQLALSEKTVKHYMTNILQKLQVRNRVEAALLAQKAGT